MLRSSQNSGCPGPSEGDLPKSRIQLHTAHTIEEGLIALKLLGQNILLGQFPQVMGHKITGVNPEREFLPSRLRSAFAVKFCLEERTMHVL